MEKPQIKKSQSKRYALYTKTDLEFTKWFMVPAIHKKPNISKKIGVGKMIVSVKKLNIYSSLK